MFETKISQLLKNGIRLDKNKPTVSWHAVEVEKFQNTTKLQPKNYTFQKYNLKLKTGKRIGHKNVMIKTNEEIQQ